MKRSFAGLLLLCLVALPFTGLMAAAPRMINSPEDLAMLASDPEGSFALGQDIDMQAIDWQPFAFRGSLDGRGYSIRNLRVTRPGTDGPQSIDGNHKRYDTEYIGLFSALEEAEIRDLHLENLSLSLTTQGNCFAGGIAGSATRSNITGCSVSGRVYVAQEGPIGGVAGIVGFGSGKITDCSVDVELVFIGDKKGVSCEQFLGGIISNGFADLEGCRVKMRGWASVRGYAHNGGLVGMYHVFTRHGDKHDGYVRDCEVDATIRFYERNTKDRRAYCKPYLGEKLHKTVTVKGNRTIHFEGKESRNYKQPLLPKDYQLP